MKRWKWILLFIALLVVFVVLAFITNIGTIFIDWMFTKAKFNF
ncbi:hypothetical protein ACJA25_02500 [Mycoplasmopsis hyopharyngis]